MTDAELENIVQAVRELEMVHPGVTSEEFALDTIRHAVAHLRKAIALGWNSDDRLARAMLAPCTLPAPERQCARCGEPITNPLHEDPMCAACIIDKFPAYGEEP